MDLTLEQLKEYFDVEKERKVFRRPLCSYDLRSYVIGYFKGTVDEFFSKLQEYLKEKNTEEQLKSSIEDNEVLELVIEVIDEPDEYQFRDGLFLNLYYSAVKRESDSDLADRLNRQIESQLKQKEKRKQQSLEKIKKRKQLGKTKQQIEAELKELQEQQTKLVEEQKKLKELL